MKGRGREILIYPRVLRALNLIKQRGFTLIEVLVVGFILSIIMAALFFSLTTGEFSISVALAKVDLQAKVRLIMDWIVKDVRQTSLIQINTNDPSENYIKFKQVTGYNTAGNCTTLSSDYIEYSYDNTSALLTRSEINGTTGAVLASWVFSNITQPPFYTSAEVPLAGDDILTSRKLLIVVSGQSQVKANLALNYSLTEEVKIRNE